MRLSGIALCVVAGGLLAGCVGTLMVGSKPGAVPPRLVIDSATGMKTWDHPRAFGPVPAEMAASAHAACSGLDTTSVRYRAIGYHPRALDLNGNPIPGGAYFCVRE